MRPSVPFALAERIAVPVPSATEDTSTVLPPSVLSDLGLVRIWGSPAPDEESKALLTPLRMRCAAAERGSSTRGKGLALAKMSNGKDRGEVPTWGQHDGRGE